MAGKNNRLGKPVRDVKGQDGPKKITIDHGNATVMAASFMAQAVQELVAIKMLLEELVDGRSE